MDLKILFGVLLGVIWAVLDAFLMRYVVRRASRDRLNASTVVTVGLLVRYLLTGVVLTCALLSSSVDAIAVVIVLIAQKAIIVLLTVLPRKAKKIS